jgi:hypothetical protein
VISIYDIKSWSDVAAFLIWTLAVCAIAKAVFGSLLSADIHYRLALRDAPRRQRVNRLNWELNNRVRWNEQAAHSSPHAAKTPLSDDELEAKRSELRQLTKASLGARAFQYFMNCLGCQTFWTALAIFVVTRGPSDVGAGVLSAAGYSGLAVLLASLGSRAVVSAIDGRSPQAGACRGCQK